MNKKSTTKFSWILKSCCTIPILLLICEIVVGLYVTINNIENSKILLISLIFAIIYSLIFSTLLLKIRKLVKTYVIFSIFSVVIFNTISFIGFIGSIHVIMVVLYNIFLIVSLVYMFLRNRVDKKYLIVLLNSIHTMFKVGVTFLLIYSSNFV